VDLGFDTIGNATLIVHDRGPLLVTDPWFEGDAYFGSWTLSHEVPPEQREAIVTAPFCWVSHGHPDHLSMASLRRMGSTTVLLADHVGGRLAAALRDAGIAVRVLPDRVWVPLSDRVRVCTIADYNQDSILLVDLDGALLVDMNDALERGSRAFVRRAAAAARTTFLLQQCAFGDADMINLFDEAGRRIPSRAAERVPPGPTLARFAERVGARFAVPFSAMHRYQRADSVWANEHLTGLDDYAPGFDSASAELLPAFVRYDHGTDTVTELRPSPAPDTIRAPSEFGDDWDEPLDADDRALLDRYVRSFGHVADSFRFVAFDVGGSVHTVDLARHRSARARRAHGLTFAAPRGSLMAAVRHEVFDDLLIGNFVRTTVHGSAEPDALYPDFTPYVGKYGDNGLARTPDELREYFRAYRARAPFDYLRHRLERVAVDRVRDLVAPGSGPERALRGVYRRVAGGRSRSPRSRAGSRTSATGNDSSEPTNRAKPQRAPSS
jgi:hypothetical protein